MSNPIIQKWVSELGLRHQGVLLTAIRGCDLDEKMGLAKPIVRAIRYIVLVPFDSRECSTTAGFMYFSYETFLESALALSRGMDSYPLHYMMHVIHACEVIGYCHPDPNVADLFRRAYFRFVFKLHLNPETEDEMTARLTEDRVAKGTVVDN